MKLLLGRLGPILIPASAAILFVSISLAATAMDSLIAFGLPESAYWPCVALVVLAVPTRILIEIMLPYFQGRGVFKPVGVIPITIALSFLPILFIMIGEYSIIGGALGVGLVNLLTLLGLILYDLRNANQGS